MIITAREIWAGTPAITRGILLMVVSTVFFAVMHGAIRYATQDLHPFQVAFFRNFFGLLVFLPIAQLAVRPYCRSNAWSFERHVSFTTGSGCGR